MTRTQLHPNPIQLFCPLDWRDVKHPHGVKND